MVAFFWGGEYDPLRSISIEKVQPFLKIAEVSNPCARPVNTSKCRDRQTDTSGQRGMNDQRDCAWWVNRSIAQLRHWSGFFFHPVLIHNPAWPHRTGSWGNILFTRLIAFAGEAAECDQLESRFHCYTTAYQTHQCVFLSSKHNKSERGQRDHLIFPSVLGTSISLFKYKVLILPQISSDFKDFRFTF